MSKKWAVLGAGLVALDAVVVREASPPYPAAAGGSCGNVLAILSWLGWSSQVLARLGNDRAGHLVTQDLHKFGVDVDLVQFDESPITPIIFEMLGPAGHRFSFICPQCKKWLPRFRPPTLRALTRWGQVSFGDVFYFDRSFPAALKLAMEARTLGRLVFFEPSQRLAPRDLYRAFDTANIVKYARGRAQVVPDHLLSKIGRSSLIIETLGSAGLRYKAYGSDWEYRPAFQPPSVVDTAGAGDWFTAGVIHCLHLSESKDIEAALAMGQAFASINCQYIGARGLMYHMSLEDFLADVAVVISGGSPPKRDGVWRGCKMWLDQFCPGCI